MTALLHLEEDYRVEHTHKAPKAITAQDGVQAELRKDDSLISLLDEMSESKGTAEATVGWDWRVVQVSVPVPTV